MALKERKASTTMDLESTLVAIEEAAAAVAVDFEDAPPAAAASPAALGASVRVCEPKKSLGGGPVVTA